MSFQIDEQQGVKARIKVVGVGGGGCNAIENMFTSSLTGVEFIAINTDLKQLDRVLTHHKMQIGVELTKGLGAGGHPEIGRKSAIEDRQAIAESLEGADLVFIASGMGGGTGTGATPVVAEIAQELGILSVGIVTTPFFFEGKKRKETAFGGIKELKRHVDTLMVVSNDQIQRVIPKGTSLINAFQAANNTLKQAIQCITDLILLPGYINVDFADVKTIMAKGGSAFIGMGTGREEGAAAKAIEAALNNPLLDCSTIRNARRILLNISGNENFTHDEMQETIKRVYDEAHEDVNLICGVTFNSSQDNEVKIAIIATGFENSSEPVKLDLPKWSSTGLTTDVKATSKLLTKSCK